MAYEHYQIMAEIFEYPGKPYKEQVQEAQKRLRENYPEAHAMLQPFVDYVERANKYQLEEIYTRTFDVQAICCPDIGYVMFGEDYKRGKLLANLAHEHDETGVNCRNELADYLPNILSLLTNLESFPEKQETRDELIGLVLLPALNRILAEFDEQKLAKKEKVYYKHHKTIIEKSADYALIYQYPLKALSMILKTDFPNVPEPEETPDSDFISNVDQEITMEEKKDQAQS